MNKHILYLFVSIVIICDTMEIIPEIPKMLSLNSAYFRDVQFNVRRYTRRGKYVINLCGKLLATLDNNATVDVVLYEYLHNEFKPSFIQNKYKLCDLINHDPYIGEVIRNTGIKCPVVRGTYNMTNLTMDHPAIQYFPYKWPIARGKANVKFTGTYTKELLAEGYIIVTFKQNNAHSRVPTK